MQNYECAQILLIEYTEQGAAFADTSFFVQPVLTIARSRIWAGMISLASTGPAVCLAWRCPRRADATVWFPRRGAKPGAHLLVK